jgi:flagellar protein FliO/FliZ
MPSIENQPYIPLAPTPAVNTAISWWGYIGMVSIFIIILIISLVVLKTLRKSNFGISESKWVKVLDRQQLGGQQMLYLVEIAGKLQVLGGSDNSLVKISEIDNPEVATEILEDIANRPFEESGGVLPLFFGKLTGFKKNRDFSVELEQIMEEAKREDQKH